MNKYSCILHPSQTVLVIVRKEYLSLCDGNETASAIISHFEYITNGRLGDGRAVANQDTWFHKSNRELRDDLLNLYSDKTISAALDLLIRKGFIKRRNNPKNRADRTYQYQLQIEKVQSALDEWSLGNSTESSRKNTQSIQEIYEMDSVNLHDGIRKSTETIQEKEEVVENTEKKKEKEQPPFVSPTDETLVEVLNDDNGNPVKTQLDEPSVEVPTTTSNQPAHSAQNRMPEIGEPGYVLPWNRDYKPQTRRLIRGEKEGWKRVDYPHCHKFSESYTAPKYGAGDKRIQAAVAFTFNISPGGFAGRRAQQLLGLATGKAAQFNVSPSMNPTEIIAFGLWYGSKYAGQNMVEQAEQIEAYVLRFRDYMQDIQDNDPLRLVSLWKVSESKLAMLMKEGDPHEELDEWVKIEGEA